MEMESFSEERVQSFEYLPTRNDSGADWCRQGRLRAVSRSSTLPILQPRQAPPFQNGKQILKGALSFASRIGLLLFSRIFFNRAWQTLQAATLCQSFLRLLGFKLHPAPMVSQPLESISAPVMTLTITKPLLQWILPDVYRTAKFWKRLIPIYTRYMVTKLQVRNKSSEERHAIWAKRHEWGGRMVHQLVLDMSGFYVKSAQILASKADFVPEEWRKWLSKHLDDGTPRPFAEVKRSIEKELTKCQPEKAGKGGVVPLEAVFLTVERQPLATASIAQVHTATLFDGTPVVIKVQHLGMDTRMHSDLRNLARVARFLKGQLPVDLAPIVKEIQATIPLEFNFEREIWFMMKIKNSLDIHGYKRIICPSPVTSLCTQRLIVMQRLDGIPFTHILHRDGKETLEARLPEVRSVVRHLLDAYGQMLLVDGVFHADPHAGNLLLCPDGRLGLLDYGQSKVLGDTARVQFAKMVISLANADDNATARVLSHMGISFGNQQQRDEIPVQVLAMMARMLFDTCYIEEATVSPMAENSILRKVPMTSFNQELWLVVRTILILRGLLFSLNMDVSAVAVWKPYAEGQIHN